MSCMQSETPIKHPWFFITSYISVSYYVFFILLIKFTYFKFWKNSGIFNIFSCHTYFIAWVWWKSNLWGNWAVPAIEIHYCIENYCIINPWYVKQIGCKKNHWVFVAVDVHVIEIHYFTSIAWWYGVYMNHHWHIISWLKEFLF